MRVLATVTLSITPASRVVLGGSPDTTSAIDSVGINWMSACIAFHERVGNLRQDDKICGMNLVNSVNRACIAKAVTDYNLSPL